MSDDTETRKIDSKLYYCSTCDARFHEMGGFCLQKPQDIEGSSLPMYSCKDCMSWIKEHWDYVCSFATGERRVSRADVVSKLRYDIHRDRGIKAKLERKQGTQFVG